MSDDVVSDCIQTILKFCRSIETAMEHFGNDEEDFLENELYQNSCCFAILQIGGAVKRLPIDITGEYPEILWSNIAKMYDLIAHGYQKTDVCGIWIHIDYEIPILQQTCEGILHRVQQTSGDFWDEESVKKGDSEMTKEHNFNFPGEGELRKIGATWFVSYYYSQTIDCSHKNWERVATVKVRRYKFERTREYHNLWLKKVLMMKNMNLAKNTMGLTPEQVKRMARELLEM